MLQTLPILVILFDISILYYLLEADYSILKRNVHTMYVYIYIYLPTLLHDTVWYIQSSIYHMFSAVFRCYLSIFLQPPRMVTEEEKELQDTARVRRMYLSQLYIHVYDYDILWLWWLWSMHVSISWSFFLCIYVYLWGHLHIYILYTYN